MNRMINMIVRQVMRQAMNKGIEVGINKAAGPKNGGKATPEDKAAMKRVRQSAKMMRRITRF